jgi:ParB-like chromosome segregation protein Spo0J
MAPKTDKTVAAPVVTTLDTTKKSIFMMDPAEVFIIGVDGGTNESTPGYDPRVKKPVDPLMVESIKAHGVIRPIIAYKDGERTVAWDGKRRTLHSRIANLQLQAANPSITAEQLVKVPVVMMRGDELHKETVRNVANAYALKDDPVDEAKSMQRMFDKGATLQQVILAFGLPKVTIEDRLKLLDLAPEAMKAISDQQLTINAGLEMAKVPMAEQVRILQTARDAAVAQGVKDGKLSTKVVQNEVKNARAAGNTTTPTRKTPKERCTEAVAVLETLALELAKLELERTKGKATPQDVAKAVPPHDAMYSALRKVYRLLGDGTTWDAKVKSTTKELLQASEESAA